MFVHKEKKKFMKNLKIFRYFFTIFIITSTAHLFAQTQAEFRCGFGQRPQLTNLSNDGQSPSIDPQDPKVCSKVLYGKELEQLASGDLGTSLGKLDADKYLQLVRRVNNSSEAVLEAKKACHNTGNIQNCNQKINSPQVWNATAGKCIAAIAAYYHYMTDQGQPLNEGDSNGGGGNQNVIASFDGQIRCVYRKNPMSLDYKGCAEFVTYYNASMATEETLKVVNTFNQQREGMNAQRDLAQDIARGNGQSSSINATRRVTLAQAQSAQNLLAFNATKAAVFGRKLYTFPEPKQPLDCGGPMDACCNHVKNFDGLNQFYPNQRQRAVIAAGIAKAVGDAAAAHLTEQQLRDQANGLSNLQQQMQNQEETAMEDVFSFCQKYPNDKRCERVNITSPGAWSSSNDGFNLTTGQNGSIDFAQPGGSINAKGDAATAAAGEKKEPTSDITPFASDLKAAREKFADPTAANSGRGNGNPVMGGGGGGAAPSAQLPGGGDQRAAQNQGEDKPSEIAPNKVNASYVSDKYAYSASGSKAGREPASEAGLSFDNLFKKESHPLAQGVQIEEGVLPKSYQLFEKISQRYGDVLKRNAIYNFEPGELK
jgi:hypothetical protein